jgi:hypothetical protein
MRVLNPIASNQELMRASLLPGLEERHRQRPVPRELPPVRNRPGGHGQQEVCPHLVAAL